MGIFFCKQEKQPPTKELKPTQNQPYDYYRCSPLRYMGFSSVIAGKMVPPQFSHIPNMAATAYVMSDVFNKTLASVDNYDDPHRTAVTAVDALLWQTMASVIAPLLLFSGLKAATRVVLKPRPPPMPRPNKSPKAQGPNLADKCGSPISTCPHQPKITCPPPPPPPPPRPPHCRCSAAAVDEFPTPAFLRIFPGVVSLLLMPFILSPIQDLVDELMDATYRKWATSYLKKVELSPQERKERDMILKAKADQAAKEAAEKARDLEKARLEKEKEAARVAEEKAKIRAKEEEMARARRLKEEKEEKEKARKKCLEEEKLRREQLLEEERVAKEKIKQEEAELLERKARIAKEFKEKSDKKVSCD